jgi:hypothetical protein
MFDSVIMEMTEKLKVCIKLRIIIMICIVVKKSCYKSFVIVLNFVILLVIKCENFVFVSWEMVAC